jgi:uncharacterized protein YcbX
MPIELGHIRDLFRYTVKSMAGVGVKCARLGWHGVEGDRRWAVRRLADRGAFPWLTASRLPELLLYQPFGPQGATGDLPSDRGQTHVRTPEGKEYAITDDTLRQDIAARHGAEVELMSFRNGIFDEAAVSVIALETIRGIARETGLPETPPALLTPPPAPPRSGEGSEALPLPAAGRGWGGVFGWDDARRFRPNLVIETKDGRPFEEDRWVGKVLEFGEDGTGPAISVTMRDLRCVMINLDPDTAAANGEVMKAVVRLNDNHAGVYGTVVRTGELRVGQVVRVRE